MSGPPAPAPVPVAGRGQGPAAGPGAAPAAPPAEYLAGRYRLDHVLGRGAMGRVWAAHDESLNRWVAIKLVHLPPGLPASEADQVAERAMREARAIASVSDPHVVTIFDLLEVDHTPAMVMELLDARSLWSMLTRDGAIDEFAAATVGFGVASALVAAHAAGVTHRDVKPGNVLVCRDGRIKLTDFGIARSVGENSLTATGLLLGSPAYISPEVASGATATPASDAWGLGALLFACVQGAPPFDRGSPLRTLTSVVNDPVPPHRASGRLGGLINALLVKDPGRRMPVARAHATLRELAGERNGPWLIGPPRRAAGPPAPAPAPAEPRPGPPTGPPRLRPGSSPAAAGRVAAATATPSRATVRPPAELPPPPWAGAAALALPALPGRARPPGRVVKLVGIPGVALLAAALGFFGVRAAAQLSAPTPPTPAGPASSDGNR